MAIPHPNTLTGSITNVIHEAAGELGFENEVRTVEDLAKKALMRAQANSPANVHTALHGIISGYENSNVDEQKYSQLLSVDKIAANACYFAEQAYYLKRNKQTPKDQFTDFLKQYAEQEAGPEEAAKNLKDSLNAMVIRLVHTMHPKIDSTPETTAFETAIEQIMEQPGMLEEAAGVLRLTTQAKLAIKEKTKTFLSAVSKGEAYITPHKQVTVADEELIEKRNEEQIRKHLNSVFNAWNDAVKDSQVFNEAQREALRITDEDRKRIIMICTWGLSADADGREKSTSQLLYETMMKVLAEKTGLIFDLRQNSRKHEEYFNAVLQVGFRNSYRENYAHEHGNGQPLHEFCKSFMAEREKMPRYQHSKWLGSQHSLFAQLVEKPQEGIFDKSEFLEALLTAGYRLVPRQLATDVKDFNETIGPLKRKFLEVHRKEIENAGLSPDTITYEEMLKVSVPYCSERDLTGVSGEELGRIKNKAREYGWSDDLMEGGIYRLKGTDKNSDAIPEETDDTLVPLQAKWDNVVKAHGFELISGLQYNRLLGGTPDELEMMKYLSNTFGIDKQGNLIAHSQEERSTLMDIAKRLCVVREFLDKSPDKPVVTRYQLANFSSPSDFLIALKLFEDADLLQINRDKEKPEVTKTDIGIMPLLETNEDLDASKAIFNRILKSDIAMSYFKARGKQMGLEDGKGYAEIMVGYSDGAASAGNFASRWKIYKTMRNISEEYAKYGIEVHFFHGRGRSTDRGGMVDPALEVDVKPAAVNKYCHEDVTAQADLPLDTASISSYGEDYFTRMTVGLLKGRQEAIRNKDKATVDLLNEYERAIDWISERSASIYNDVCRKRKDGEHLQFYNNSPSNPEKSSRYAGRVGADATKVDNIRAVPKEDYSGGADLMVHNVGLKQAMQEFLAFWKDGKWVGPKDGMPPLDELKILNEKNKPVTGSAALMALKNHQFFDATMKTIAASVQHFDPDVADIYAEITGAKNFVKDVKDHNSSLAGLMAYHKLGGLESKGPKVSKASDEKSTAAWASALDVLAHAATYAGFKKRFNEEDVRQNAETRFTETYPHGSERERNEYLKAAIDQARKDAIKPSKNVDKSWWSALKNLVFTTLQELRLRDIPGRQQELASARRA